MSQENVEIVKRFHPGGECSIFLTIRSKRGYVRYCRRYGPSQ
jgi:hypothetical protein